MLLPAEGVFSLIWVLIALPLGGAAILLLAGRRTNSWGPDLGVLTVLGSAAIGVLMLLEMMQQPAEERTYGQELFTWIQVG
ncbi:MAG: NADH-quinone oxidoreductase subunit L, partial [Candidatus Nanopelagicales bacterium]